MTEPTLSLCQSCFGGDMNTPANGHPAYVECPYCGAIELTYIPQEYQQEMHSVPIVEHWSTQRETWEYQAQIVGVFGGLKIPCPL